MLQECIHTIEQNMDEAELERLARTLVSAYQSYLLDVQVWEVLERILPINIFSLLLPYKKTIVGHHIVNSLVLKHFPGECTIKYELIKRFINKQDQISVFEMNVGSSRLDIGRINGDSYAYEIKTELDSLEKLDKQIHDYSKVFDYIYIAVHKRHLTRTLEIVPDYCGVISFRKEKDRWIFHYVKKAYGNPYINPEQQLATLTTKELEAILKLKKVPYIPKGREERERMILGFLSSKEINTFFKNAIKKRFRRRWEFLEKNFDLINPIDVQSFFKSPFDPYWAYYKNSSMV